MTATMMVMLAGLCLFVIAVPLSAAPPAAVYDQRQTGDVNVQIELENVHIIALLNSELDDYTDYDYFYDYADFTLKPSDRPTTSSSTTAASPERDDVTPITEAAASSSQPNSTASPVNAANSIGEETPPAVDPSNGTVNSTTSITTDDKSQASEENAPGPIDVASSSSTSTLSAATRPITTTAKPVQALRSKKRCKSGYVPTGNGRCRRANRRWLSLP